MNRVRPRSVASRESWDANDACSTMTRMNLMAEADQGADTSMQARRQPSQLQLPHPPHSLGGRLSRMLCMFLQRRRALWVS